MVYRFAEAGDNREGEIVRTLIGGFALVLGLATGATGIAQTFPAKPITIVVPFSAGGPTDTLARIMSERLRTVLGQTILIDNTTGAGGTLGTGRVVRAAPDGYVLSIGHWGTHVVNGAYYTKLPFDLLNDFAPIAQIAANPQTIISKNSVPAKNLKELIALIKANPGNVLVATGGMGGASHIVGTYFGNRIGAKFDFVAYRGGAPALQALLVGEVDLFVTQVGSMVTLWRAGKVRAYAVTDKKRQEAAPEIPTVDEAGLPGLYTSVWHGIWAPKATPKDVVMKLNAAFVETLADPTVRQRFADLGQNIPPREQQTPEALYAYHKSEIDKWWPLIRAAGIKAE